MWLKQLIIDGFKSYADRTVIDGWDPSFTAITGQLQLDAVVEHTRNHAYTTSWASSHSICYA